MKLITETMGKMYTGTMHRDCVIKNERSAGEGSASPHLAKLDGLRLAACEETGEACRLHDDNIKAMAGDSYITARALYKNEIAFRCSHLPVLVTNHRPTFNGGDDAMRRRLLLIPFDLQFRPPHTFDPNNPRHRPMDQNVRRWAASDEAKEAMLTWMVRGAIDWYRGGLGTPAAKFAEASRRYVEENDLLTEFLREHCRQGKDLRIESKDLLAHFNQCDLGETWDTKRFKKEMVARGYEYKKIRISGVMKVCVLGVVAHDPEDG